MNGRFHSLSLLTSTGTRKLVVVSGECVAPPPPAIELRRGLDDDMMLFRPLIMVDRQEDGGSIRLLLLRLADNKARLTLDAADDDVGKLAPGRDDKDDRPLDRDDNMGMEKRLLVMIAAAAALATSTWSLPLGCCSCGCLL